MISIMKREVRMGFRNPWAYTFIFLFIMFMLALLLINQQGYTSSYSGVTGTLINLSLYLIPLITMMLGSFSLTGEKEDGSAQLLYTYTISSWQMIFGKYIGLAIMMLTIITIGFSVTGIISAVLEGGFAFTSYLTLFFFAALLSLTFLGISFVIGALTKNRWQALTSVISVWFFLIIAWVPLLIAFLGKLPYSTIKPVLSLLTMLNPAEFIRIFTVVKLGGGSILGPEYYSWVTWLKPSSGTLAFIMLCIIYTLGLLALTSWLWERGKRSA